MSEAASRAIPATVSGAVPVLRRTPVLSVRITLAAAASVGDRRVVVVEVAPSAGAARLACPQGCRSAGTRSGSRRSRRTVSVRCCVCGCCCPGSPKGRRLPVPRRPRTPLPRSRRAREFVELDGDACEAAPGGGWLVGCMLAPPVVVRLVRQGCAEPLRRHIARGAMFGWADTEVCDYDGAHPWRCLQRLARRSAAGTRSLPLCAIYSSAVRAGGGGVLLIEGAAGMGKSRLIGEGRRVGEAPLVPGRCQLG
jgi:hypothetical protein